MGEMLRWATDDAKSRGESDRCTTRFGPNLLLVGVRYAGKTTVGRLIAAQVGRDFVDTDDLVECVARQAAAEIFRKNGEAEFRRLERAAVESACTMSGVVVSAGGGAVLHPENRARLHAAGLCVWLTASEAEIARRHATDAHRASRPALTQLPFADEVRQVLGERSPLYAQVAHVRVATDGLTPEAVAAAIRATPEFQVWFEGLGCSTA
jgi:shikimate kinase